MSASEDAMSPWRPALLQAAGNGDAKGVRLALSKGANVNQVDEEGQGALFMAFLSGFEEGLGAEEGGLATVKELLAAGADPCAREQTGAQPIHMAARYEAPVAALRLLIDAGASVGARDNDGWEPLRWATAGGREEKVAALCAWGADILAQDKYGTSALAAAEKASPRCAGVMRAALEAKELSEELAGAAKPAETLEERPEGALGAKRGALRARGSL